jgi:NAD(P)-dependent dehydrogenase (short-subunit alcohol dehydrogenase family)
MVDQKSGNIIVMSSIAGIIGGTARPYSAAKTGQIRLVAGLAQDLGPYNIRVNAISPGLVRTPLGVVQRPSEVAAYDDPEVLKRIPLGRVTEPVDIASMALFLASEASNHITGQNIVVDGGLRPEITF